jgi:hypothetical protein
MGIDRPGMNTSQLRVGSIESELEFNLTQTHELLTCIDSIYLVFCVNKVKGVCIFQEMVLIASFQNMDNAYSGYWASFGPDTQLSGTDGTLSVFDFTPDLIEKVSNICLYA